MIDLATLRRRLSFRSWHRGTKGMDLILGRFADAALDRYDGEGLERYGRFLEESDPDIYDWLTGRAVPQGHRHRTVLQDLIAFHRLDGAHP